jgi:chromate transporter
MKRSKLISTLFLCFFKIGAFTFGGGYAMLALLENEFVEKKKWLTKDEFLDMLAIAESTPGPIAINSATFIGYKTAGVLGSTLATLGVVLPSFIIIFIISLFLDKFLTFSLVANAFRGIQACVVYLIGSTGIKLFKQMEKKALPLTIMSAILVCMVLFSLFAVKFSSIVFIIVSGLIGIIAFYGKAGKKEAKK